MNAKNQGAWATGRQRARNGSSSTMNLLASASQQARVRPDLVQPTNEYNQNRTIEFTQALLSKDDNLPSKLNKVPAPEKPKPAPRKED